MTMLGLKHSAETRAKMSAARMGRKLTEEHRRNISNGHAGEKSSLWKGGHPPDARGYIRAWVGPRKYRTVHQLVAEKALGRALKTNECVHHINENRADNRNSNLLICTRSYHRRLHARMKKRAENIFQEVLP